MQHVTSASGNLGRAIASYGYGLVTPTRSSEIPIPTSEETDLAVKTTSLNKPGQNPLINHNPDSHHQSRGRVVLNAPRQFFESPPLDGFTDQERALPPLPTSLNVQEQKNILKQVHRCLSQCAFSFCAKHRLPISSRHNTRPVKGAQDCEWDEWVFILKSLGAKKRISSRMLYDGEATQFDTTLESSLGAHYGVNPLRYCLTDDRNILQLISASVRVAKMLKDGTVMRYLDRLYVKTEAVMQKHTSAASKM